MGCASLGILRSNSVTIQVNFNKTKIGEKCQKSKIQMRHFGWFSNNMQWVRNYLFTLYLTYNQWNFCDHCHIRDKFTHSILTPEFFIMEASIRKVVEQLNLNLKVAEEEKKLWRRRRRRKRSQSSSGATAFLFSLSFLSRRSFSLSIPVLWHLE